MSMLRQLARDTGRAMLLSTHDLDLALRASDRVWLLPKLGRLTVGAPEDLVLSGAFEAAFASEGVEFAPELGSFRIRSTHRGHVHVQGSGLAHVWTVRALERAGYTVVGAPAHTRIHVQTRDAETSWRIEGGRDVHCRSIEHVIDELAGAVETPRH
jgi:iron complex transport system ATP-binding protein